MKIKLLYAPRLYETGRFGYQGSHALFPPLGIALVTSFLRKNKIESSQDDLDIKVWHDNTYSKDTSKKVDMALFDDRKRVLDFTKNGKDSLLQKEAEKILEKTEYHGYDIIGFSIIDDHNFSVLGCTIVLAKLIKERTNAIIIIGGLRHSRKIHEISLVNLDYIDFVVLEDHVTLLELLYFLERGNLDNIKDKNIVFKKQNIKKYMKYKKRKNFSINIDKKHLKKDRWGCNLAEDILPKPDFEALPLDLYKYNLKKCSHKSILLLPYSFVIGCNNGCIFCPNSEKPHIFCKPPKVVSREVKELSLKYKTKYFIFLNTNVNPSYKYTEELSYWFMRNNVNVLWISCANFRYLDKKLLKKLRKIGAIKLIYGLESASQKMLDYIEKGVTLKKARKLLKYGHRIGIWNEIELIAGMPHETKQDINNTIKFIQKNKKYINYFHLAKFILMNSKLKRYSKKYGICNIKDNIGNIYNLTHFTRSFDEVNGLKWREKVKQIEYSYKTIEKVINQHHWGSLNGYGQLHDDLHRLLYLYSTFTKKKKVLNYFRQQLLK